MTKLIVNVSDEQKTVLEGLFHQLHIPFREVGQTATSADTAQHVLDPVALRTIIDYGIIEPESEIRPYAHVSDAAAYIREKRNTEWQ